MSTVIRPQIGRAVELLRHEASEAPQTFHYLQGKMEQRLDQVISRIRPFALLVKTIYVSRLRDSINLAYLIGLPVLLFWVCVAASKLLPQAALTHADTFVATTALFISVCVAGVAFGMRSSAHAQADGSERMLGSMPFSKTLEWAIDGVLGILFSLTSSVVLAIVATAPIYDLGIDGNVPALILPLTIGYLFNYNVGRLGSFCLPGHRQIIRILSTATLTLFAALAVLEVMSVANLAESTSAHFALTISPVSSLFGAIGDSLRADTPWANLGISTAYLLIFTVAVMTATRASWSLQKESDTRRER